MDTLDECTNDLRNIDAPFTDLFSTMARYNLSNHTPELVYNVKELKLITNHCSNVIDVLLQGLQTLGQLITMINVDKRINNSALDVGFLVSAISNLIEALNNLRLDTDYSLRQKGIVNY